MQSCRRAAQAKLLQPVLPDADQSANEPGVHHGLRCALSGVIIIMIGSDCSKSDIMNTFNII